MIEKIPDVGVIFTIRTPNTYNVKITEKAMI